MKPKIFIIFIMPVLTLILVGCSFKEEYAMQYTIVDQAGIETKVTATDDGVKLEIPFADFTCDIKSVKATLERNESIFSVFIQGNETPARCSQKFSADINGVSPGSYQLKVYYQRGEEKQVVLVEDFQVTQ
ncbi:MAG: hypothetical protein RB292_00770 [Patescibacteria group bacterium]|jgi:hypothetical protein|nr:hypothetical protein [Patescibacteria group bacterium]